MASQLGALSATQSHFRDSEMAILKQRMDRMALELERARMTAENARSDVRRLMRDRSNPAQEKLALIEDKQFET